MCHCDTTRAGAPLSHGRGFRTFCWLAQSQHDSQNGINPHSSALHPGSVRRFSAKRKHLKMLHLSNQTAPSDKNSAAETRNLNNLYLGCAPISDKLASGFCAGPRPSAAQSAGTCTVMQAAVGRQRTTAKMIVVVSANSRCVHRRRTVIIKISARAL